jgi:hypothetical protein
MPLIGIALDYLHERKARKVMDIKDKIYIK